MINYPDNFQVEDAFTVDENGWINLPGNQGRVSPDGTVYDQNGEPMYSLYEDSEAPLSVYLDDDEEYEWM